VIPMRVTDEDMTAQAFGAGRNQILAERVSSSPTINDNKCSTRGAHLNARRVSSVASRARSRFGYRTARAPELDAHEAPYLGTLRNMFILPGLARILNGGGLCRN
jgi:hypothetical protein